MTSLGSNDALGRRQDSQSDARLPSILIADDSHELANILSSQFREHGYETRVAYDGLLALDAAKAHLPDVILLDLGMPELDGIHLAQFIREDENLKDKVLIAITAYADEMHRSQCAAVGFDHVLQKPAVWKDIKSIIDRLWSARKMVTNDDDTVHQR